jgi:hypothetical protein
MMKRRKMPKKRRLIKVDWKLLEALQNEDDEGQKDADELSFPLSFILSKSVQI